MSSSRRSLSWNHARASGLVKSTIPILARQRSHCQTLPSGRRTRYPCCLASSNSGERCAMYGLIQALIRSPLAFSRSSIPGGSGKVRGSHGSRAPVELPHPEAVEVEDAERQVAPSAIPSTNEVTVASS